MAVPEFVYKVADSDLFAEAAERGTFAGAGVDLADGYIHFSTADQLSETLRRHFAGKTRLTLAAVRTADLGAALRWEPSRGDDLFPHLYAALPMSAVAWTAPIAVASDGTAALPAGVQ